MWFVYYLFDLLLPKRCRNMHIVCAITNFVIPTERIWLLNRSQCVFFFFFYHDLCLYIQLISSFWSHCFVIIRMNFCYTLNGIAIHTNESIWLKNVACFQIILTLVAKLAQLTTLNFVDFFVMHQHINKLIAASF